MSYVYLLSLLISTPIIIILYKGALAFLEEGKNEIIKFYSKGYPYVCIKAPSGVIQGKVEDIFNKHLIVLNKNGVQKLTSWNNIGIIEIRSNDK